MVIMRYHFYFVLIFDKLAEALPNFSVQGLSEHGAENTLPSLYEKSIILSCFDFLNSVIDVDTQVAMNSKPSNVNCTSEFTPEKID